MPKTKRAITLERDLVEDLDELVANQHFVNRSQAIAAALAEKLGRLAHTRLAREAAKLDTREEKRFAEEGLSTDTTTWPVYEPGSTGCVSADLGIEHAWLAENVPGSRSARSRFATERIGRRLARVANEELARVVEGLNEIVGG